MFLHEVEPLAQFECRANRLAVVFGDAEQTIDAVVAFRILDAAGAHERSVDRLSSGKNLDAIDVKLAARMRRAVSVDAQEQIAGDTGERRGHVRRVFDVARRELRGGELQTGGVD